jgi:lactoylglutathione lyase
MPDELGAFWVLYVSDVERSVRFYERFGFSIRFAFPSEAEPGYVKLVRGTSELGIVTEQSPIDLIGTGKGEGRRGEMYIFVDDVDAFVNALPDEVTVLRPPEDMPWGERIAYLADPDDNPVVVATGASK